MFNDPLGVKGHLHTRKSSRISPRKTHNENQIQAKMIFVNNVRAKIKLEHCSNFDFRGDFRDDFRVCKPRFSEQKERKIDGGRKRRRI